MLREALSYAELAEQQVRVLLSELPHVHRGWMMSHCEHVWQYYELNGQPGLACANCHTWIPFLGGVMKETGSCWCGRIRPCPLHGGK